MKGRAVDERSASVTAIVRISKKDAAPLFERFHAYGGMGAACTYLFGVVEGSRIVAVYAWQPPPLGCARSVLPAAPWGVLSLSRMVAIPKPERELKHISKPLKKIMKTHIDRTRWPALVTFSDEGLGHNGFVYQCSGWTKTTRRETLQFVDENGRRTSKYNNGKTSTKHIRSIGRSFIQRWENHATEPARVLEYLSGHGWARVPIPGKTWTSGKQAHTIIKVDSPLFADVAIDQP